MAKYRVKFHGRLSNAIGITYDIEDIVAIPDNMAENQIYNEVIKAIYMQYEHVRWLSYEEII